MQLEVFKVSRNCLTNEYGMKMPIISKYSKCFDSFVKYFWSIRVDSQVSSFWSTQNAVRSILSVHQMFDKYVCDRGMPWTQLLFWSIQMQLEVF